MCIVNGCCEGGAPRESPISNARDAIRDSDGSEGRTTRESIIPNARYAVGDGDRSKGGATSESQISNARYAVGDGDGSKGGASIESALSNARHAVRDDRLLTTCNKGISSGFDNCIALQLLRLSYVVLPSSTMIEIS